MSAHTPGPWRLGTGSTNDGQVYVMSDVGVDTNRVAIVDRRSSYKRGRGYEGECPERDANARLIAAAPELLEALQSLVGCIMETRGTEATSALTLAHRAIAKATGAT